MVAGQIFCSIGIAKAAVFCVQTSSALQSALNTAANNGEADKIQIVQGTYTGNFTYETQEEYKRTVKGEYASGCTSRVVNASNTVLDGNSAGTVLMVDPEGGAGSTLIRQRTAKIRLEFSLGEHG